MANTESRALVVDIEARVDKLEKSMARAKKVANDNYKGIENRTQTMVGRVNDKLGSIGKEFAIGVGGGIVAAMAPLALFHKAIDDLGSANSLKQLSDRIGLSTDNIQALQFGAQKVGVNIDQMNDGLADFAAKVAEAASGAGQLAPIFKANNIELKKADGTLRSTRDVLGDFANLIANARTPQEQLFLAQQAFGDEAAKLVPLLKNGAAGLDNLQTAARDAGAVIDSDLVTRAAALDQQFQSMWQTFSTQSKGAILGAVDYLAHLQQNMAQFGQKYGLDKIGEAIAGSGIGKALGAHTIGDGSTIANMLGGIDKIASTGTPAKPTIIPASTSGSGSGGSKSMKESVDYAQRLIDNLERQRDLIGASELEIQKSNALWRAGTDATAAQKAEIAGLVTAIYTAKEAEEKHKKAIEDTRDAARDFAGTLVNGLIEGKNAADVLTQAVQQLASRLLNSGLDQLFGVGGGGFNLGSLFGGGGLSRTAMAAIAGGAGGLYANGTNYAKGGLSLVGERGPELINLPRGSQVIPNDVLRHGISMPTVAHRGGGGGGAPVINFAPTIDARGAQQGVGAEIAAALDKYSRKSLPALVAQINKDPRRRG